MIVSEIDIPSLTDEGIQLNSAFNDVQELNSSSMIDWLIDNDWDADSLDRFIRKHSWIMQNEWEKVHRIWTNVVESVCWICKPEVDVDARNDWHHFTMTITHIKLNRTQIIHKNCWHVQMTKLTNIVQSHSSQSQ